MASVLLKANQRPRRLGRQIQLEALLIDAHETLIRQRAYEIWEGEGRPEGRSDLHWEQAMRELEMQASASPIVTDVPAEKPAKRKAASKVTPIAAATKARKTRQPSA
ncbi:MAG: DUF2934 domain-containing protein [Bauldia sp.]|nr:DUF2934 domain-containing protein [Bauldia sp.]